MRFILNFLFLFLPFIAQSQSDTILILEPEWVFDGEQMQTGWLVAIQGELILAAGPAKDLTIPTGIQKKTTRFGVVYTYWHRLGSPSFGKQNRLYPYIRT